ncbi:MULTISPECIES: ribosome-binding factor A [Thermus]|jgi:ribosome-binding factor A|uniref:Ribosome-binding factor A n=1 Tax=Thermus brockianus TaxID=56956 RepID=A0A1J0LRU7_THEBO|nr:ribosome-binding factor A [Thermus brockianus]APD08451.1 ribosome-binding factor A [Thermus brockianus]BDG16200.1 ribosome-binding factor A [Thermus brockianus]
MYGRAHLEERLKRALAEALQGLEDPRLFLLTVEAVRLSPDGKVLTVYVEAFAEEEKALAALEHAKGRLLSALAERVRLRRLPRLAFMPWRPQPS